ncbi:hypothetical protein PIB30_068280 [Stylosanthes scabra]|uniref:Uncharacterized protein n=1 Tax=Stylosanthes scabra TaxID=79078 RepID=A0ABU6RN25_9FABA|nr:hypothetical protein [Stylosanthes scabra]
MLYACGAIVQGKAWGNCRDKPIIELDSEIEKTLKKNQSRVKAQRALQLEQQEANSDEGASEKFSKEDIVEENSEEEIQDNMTDNANGELLWITLIPLLLAEEAVLFGPL